MSIIRIILYIAGYTFNFASHEQEPPLDIELGKPNVYVARPRAKHNDHFRRKIMSWIYFCFIICIITWTVPYTFYMAIRDKTIIHFGRSWFQIMFGLQYYFAIKYFGKNHFYENIMCNTKLVKHTKISLPISLAISILLSIFTVCMFGFKYNIHGYSDIYIKVPAVGKVFMGVLLFLDSFYSYLTFTINAFIFAINMLYHRESVSNYAVSLENYIKNSMNTIRKLNIIATEFSQLRYKYDITVSLFTPFFSSLNFVGFATIYFYLMAISDKSISVSEIINMVLFGIVQVIYIISIQAVNNNIDNISSSILSNSVIATFFGKKQFNRIILPLDKSSESLAYKEGCSTMDRGCKEKTNVNNDLNIVRHDKTKDTIEDIDNHYNIEENLMKNTKMSSEMEVSSDSEHHAKRKRKNERNIGISSNNVYGILKQVIVSSISTEQMIDWLILQGIVNDRWVSFKIFGVEFTDSTIISKLIGVATAIFITAQIGVMIQWW